jgi:general secretion pathway protein K
MIALILVALATILATKLTYDGFIERQRSVGVLAAEQSMEFSYGAEALAADVLTRNTASGPSTLNDAWAQPTQAFPITPQNDPEGEPIGAMAGSIEDLTGRFNLNTLAYIDPTTKLPAKFTLDQFQRILVAAGVEPKWAGIAQDWIDADQNVNSPDGAEDSVYLSQVPPYRTGDYPMMSPTELMNMPGFGYERYRKIAPYVTALPTSKPSINLCTAPGVVLESLSSSTNGEFSNPDFLAKNRAEIGCFPKQSDIENIAKNDKDWQALKPYVSQQPSKYFRLTTHVSLGTYEFTLYSLLAVSTNGKITPILRSYGTP